MNQILAICQALFISARTLEYVSWGDAGFLGEGSKDMNVDMDLNWDFVPILLILMEAYLIFDAIASLLFDVGRELNRKIFNEFIRLRGKINKQKNNYNAVSFGVNSMNTKHKNHYVVQ